MFRVLAALMLVASPAAFLALPSFQSTPPAGQCPNLIPREPIVLYSQTGASLLGTMDRSLTVYGDGTARLTSFFSTFEVPGATTDVRITYAGVEAVRSLARDLSVLGAGTACDEDTQLQDGIPNTLTLLRDQTDTRGHTFTWVSLNEPYASIQARVEAFIAQQFPGS